MKNIFFVIFFKKFLRKTCWPPAPEHGDHLDPRIPCPILCPVSETHRGGSTDAQGARREGNKGMESTRITGEDQLHLSGVVQKQDALGTRGLMLTKQEKRYRYPLQTCMLVCTHMSTRDFTAFEMYWRLRLRLRTWMLPGWRGGHSCEQAGSLAMPKTGNQSQERWP